MFVLFELAALSLAWPVVMEYLETGLVPRFPTAILSTGLTLLGFLSLACGLILDTVTHSRQEIKPPALSCLAGFAGPARRMPGRRQKIRPGSCVGKHPPRSMPADVSHSLSPAAPGGAPGRGFRQFGPYFIVFMLPFTVLVSIGLGREGGTSDLLQGPGRFHAHGPGHRLDRRPGLERYRATASQPGRLAFPCTGHDSPIFLLPQSFGWPSRGSAAPGRSICRPCWSRLFSAGSSPRCFCGLPIP